MASRRVSNKDKTATPPSASPSMVTWRGVILINWAKDAACRNADIGPERDDFYGIAENAPMSRAEVSASKFICHNLCPVQRECLKAALSGEEEWGVWGGFTAPERQRAMDFYKTVNKVMMAYDNNVLGKKVIRRV